MSKKSKSLVSRFNHLTPDPFVNLMAAILYSGIKENDIKFFESDLGTRICDNLHVSPEYAISFINRKINEDSDDDEDDDIEQ